MAKIEINWLEQWVMCITGPLGHQSCELWLLQTWNYNNDLNLPSKWWVLRSTIMADVPGDLGGGTCYVANIQLSGGPSAVVSQKKPDGASMHIKHKNAPEKSCCWMDSVWQDVGDMLYLWQCPSSSLHPHSSSSSLSSVPLPPLLAWSNNMLWK